MLLLVIDHSKIDIAYQLCTFDFENLIKINKY